VRGEGRFGDGEGRANIMLSVVCRSLCGREGRYDQKWDVCDESVGIVF